MELLPAEVAQFSGLIDEILSRSDLQTISASKIRKTLQAQLSQDLDPKRDALKKLIHERFDIFDSRNSVPEPVPVPYLETPSTNGVVKHEIKSEVRSASPTTNPITYPSTQKHKTEHSSESEEFSPPKKKRKAETADEDEDAKLAKMLQAQENRSVRATRGGGGKVGKKGGVKGAKVKKPRKKSEKKVRADDDSGMEVGSDGEVKERPKKGGFHKLYNLSASLADLVGEPTLSRPQTVKKIWAHIKANDLQDPKDKRQIRCDEKMQLVFKQDNVHMFTMNKLLGKHLYDVEEE